MEELGLLREKRPRRYANKNHLTAYATQIWRRDWYQYGRPGTRVSGWGTLLSNIYTTSRIGEYRGTDRGLKYRVSKPRSSLRLCTNCRVRSGCHVRMLLERRREARTRHFTHERCQRHVPGSQEQ